LPKNKSLLRPENGFLRGKNGLEGAAVKRFAAAPLLIHPAAAGAGNLFPRLDFASPTD